MKWDYRYWSAGLYAVSREGMVSIMEQFMHGERFVLQSRYRQESDVLLFRRPGAYTVTRPLCTQTKGVFQTSVQNEGEDYLQKFRHGICRAYYGDECADLQAKMITFTPNHTVIESHCSTRWSESVRKLAIVAVIWYVRRYSSELASGCTPHHAPPLLRTPPRTTAHSCNDSNAVDHFGAPGSHQIRRARDLAHNLRQRLSSTSANGTTIEFVLLTSGFSNLTSGGVANFDRIIAVSRELQWKEREMGKNSIRHDGACTTLVTRATNYIGALALALSPSSSSSHTLRLLSTNQNLWP